MGCTASSHIAVVTGGANFAASYNFNSIGVAELLIDRAGGHVTTLAASLLDCSAFVGCIVGMLSFGYLGDRFEKRLLCVVCMIGHFIGLLAVTYATNVWWLAVFVLAHGLGWGVRGPMMVALRADYFGPRSFGTIMGISSLIVMLGMTTGPIFCGWMFDQHGNYERAFTIMACLSLSGSICFWLAKPPKRPELAPA